MHIVHWSNWGPHISGMYESVKDQVKYERRSGHRADVAVSYEKVPSQEKVDEWLIPVTWEEAMKADVWVLHANYPSELKEEAKKKVSVAVLHGPTEHMLFKEFESGQSNFNLHINLLWNNDATICLNQHEYDIMKLYDEKGDRCHYIPNSIDLESMETNMVWKYESHPAILSCDTPRVEKLPFHIIWAMPYLVDKVPTARLNVTSLVLESIGMWRNAFCRSHKRKLESLCENIQLQNNNLKPFQAGADIGFNNNYSGIASRVTMEMMAYGVPIVSYGGDYTKYHARIFDIRSIVEQIERCWNDLTAEGSTLREETKRYARENFDRAKHVAAYIKLYEELLSKK